MNGQDREEKGSGMNIGMLKVDHRPSAADAVGNSCEQRHLPEGVVAFGLERGRKPFGVGHWCDATQGSWVARSSQPWLNGPNPVWD